MILLQKLPKIFVFYLFIIYMQVIAYDINQKKIRTKQPFSKIHGVLVFDCYENQGLTVCLPMHPFNSVL